MSRKAAMLSFVTKGGRGPFTASGLAHELGWKKLVPKTDGDGNFLDTVAQCKSKTALRVARKLHAQVVKTESGDWRIEWPR